jgi:hypothetical protein
MLALTIFKSIFDNKTHRKMEFSSFDEFEDLLYKLSRTPGYKPKKDEKFNSNASPLITPATFKAGTTRANANVECWSGWAAIDVDDYPTGGFEDAIAAFRVYRHVCYSSASSKKEHPKFRVVLPLTSPVPAEKIRHFWFALNKEFKFLADPQTKDLSRMYYVPAQYPNAHNFIFSHRESPVLNPSSLMAKHPYIEKASTGILDNLSERMQKKMEEYQKGRLMNGHKYSWTSYRDCPFVKRELVNQYRSISSTGWYGLMYKIMSSIAATAIRRGYPITATEIAQLCKELDRDTGSWYKNRGMEIEASRAISFALKGAK